ncbi:hypothetical protein EVAR_19830_1 [Eumeta japonica]|uniref:Uncharacterized protein n=1 Tax=Eumeta variegata TaxID=151549 RepID=A0A4C1US29_EUMVA|nr:hypothetical protein EVAR_19830_1 [Eumeta japonica]
MKRATYFSTWPGRGRRCPSDRAGLGFQNNLRPRSSCCCLRSTSRSHSDPNNEYHKLGQIRTIHTSCSLYPFDLADVYLLPQQRPGASLGIVSPDIFSSSDLCDCYNYLQPGITTPRLESGQETEP